MNIKNDEIAKKHKQKTTNKSASQPEYELLANLENLNTRMMHLTKKLKNLRQMSAITK
jgi:hypothetical protein